MSDRLIILGGEVERVGAKLIAKTGGVRIDARYPPALQWTRDGADVLSATGREYVTGPADLGCTIGLRMEYNGGQEIEAVDPVFVTDEFIETLRPLYTFLLRREPDKAGLLFWAAHLRNMCMDGWSRDIALKRVLADYTGSEAYKREPKR